MAAGYDKTTVRAFSSNIYEYYSNPYSSYNYGYGGYSGFKTYRTTGVDFIIKYGIQRRIGNIGYFESYLQWSIPIWKDSYVNNLPISYSNPGLLNYLIPDVGIKVGFAIDSFKGLKQKFK